MYDTKNAMWTRFSSPIESQMASPRERDGEGIRSNTSIGDSVIGQSRTYVARNSFRNCAEPMRQRQVLSTIEGGGRSVAFVCEVFSIHAYSGSALRVLGAGSQEIR